jgi:SAM-dependent methyltransferase
MRDLTLTRARLAGLMRSALTIEERARRAARHQWHCVYASLLRRLRERCGPDLSHLRVLDFGAGYSAPLSLLLCRDVAEVVGLDISPTVREGLLARLRWAPPGQRRAPHAALLEYAAARRLVRHLRHLAGSPLDLSTPRLLRYPGGDLPFPDGSFDCVISNAVLQELPARTLGRYARELARVLRPGGVIDLSWHNFYSLSGNYLSTGENQRHPWGHLLGGKHDPRLNRCTPLEMLLSFAPHFRDLRLLGCDHQHRHQHRTSGEDEGFTLEGEDMLGPELAARLSRYPREWLLTRGFTLQGVRPSGR